MLANSPPLVWFPFLFCVPCFPVNFSKYFLLWYLVTPLWSISHYWALAGPGVVGRGTGPVMLPGLEPPCSPLTWEFASPPLPHYDLLLTFRFRVSYLHFASISVINCSKLLFSMTSTLIINYDSVNYDCVRVIMVYMNKIITSPLPP